MLFREQPNAEEPGRLVRWRWRIAAAVAVLAAILAVNAVLVSGETRQAEITHPRGQLLELPGGQQQIVDQGPKRRRAVVLLHCYVCSLHSWERVARRISAEERVVRVDLLGFGGSAKPGSGYDIEDQADYTAAALARLGVKRAVVAGNSFGAVVATALAERHPNFVVGVALVDQAPDGSYSDTPPLQWLSYQPVIGQLLHRITPDSAIENTIEDRIFSPGFDPARAFRDQDRIVEDFRALTYTSYTKSGQAFEDYTGHRPLDKRLASTAKPVLVIFGSEDQTYSAPESLAAYEHLSRARTALVEGAGHTPQLEHPEAVARLLLRFTYEHLGERHGQRSRSPRGKR